MQKNYSSEVNVSVSSSLLKQKEAAGRKGTLKAAQKVTFILSVFLQLNFYHIGFKFFSAFNGIYKFTVDGKIFPP